MKDLPKGKSSGTVLESSRDLVCDFTSFTLLTKKERSRPNTELTPRRDCLVEIECPDDRKV